MNFYMKCSERSSHNIEGALYIYWDTGCGILYGWELGYRWKIRQGLKDFNAKVQCIGTPP